MPHVVCVPGRECTTKLKVVTWSRYGGDALATAETALYNFHAALFYEKRVQDFVDAQRANGGFTETAPFVGIASASLSGGSYGAMLGCTHASTSPSHQSRPLCSGPIGWDTFPVHMQLQLYRFYGSTRILEQTYNATLRWIEFLESQSHGKAVLHGVRACHGCLYVHCRLVCDAKHAVHPNPALGLDGIGAEPS